MVHGYQSALLSAMEEKAWIEQGEFGAGRAENVFIWVTTIRLIKDN